MQRPGEHHVWTRRRLLRCSAGMTAAIALAGCSNEPPPGRYTQADIDALAEQREREARERGTGRHGQQRYRGYRGLAELPWFGLDARGDLCLIDDAVPDAIDFHTHLGMSLLFRPQLDLLASTPRVRHLLDCDGSDPGCELDLDIYINGNFDDEDLAQLRRYTLTQALWGNAIQRTHTIPNLLREMDTMRVSHSVVLPIKTGLPFGDRLTEDWRDAIRNAGARQRLFAGLSVYPGDGQAVEQMRAHAAAGARVMKLHPTVQQFYPDDPVVFPIYEEARALGLILFFHGGRAGIEPQDRLRYAMPRHYEGVLKNFPELPVVLGHGGARDARAMLAMSRPYANAWLGIHGQSLRMLETIIEASAGERLLFGTDWPWYHIGATLAKVLLCTDRPQRQKQRRMILRDNAIALMPELASS
jgi:predicted TIM-barrel fold metal-dependent hydrolase